VFVVKVSVCLPYQDAPVLLAGREEVGTRKVLDAEVARLMERITARLQKL
jgi:hypothetical protein